MQRLIDAVERHGGQVTLVLLTCALEILLERVVNESRARFGKLRAPETLSGLLAEYRLTEPFPGHLSLVIDNTYRSAEDVAGEIAAALTSAI